MQRNSVKSKRLLAGGVAMLALCAGAALTSPANAGDIDNIFVFGDSLSDMGTFNDNRFVASGNNSNGEKNLTWSEYLAGELGIDIGKNSEVTITADGSSTEVIHPDGTNYAQGGATVADGG